MTDVLVQFLGSGDAFGSGGRYQTCVYVAAEKFHCLIDCGASSLIAMKRWSIDPSSIDVILLSHLHGDHFGGLPFFILDAQLISKRTKPLVVAGPAGLERRIHEAMEVFFPGSSGIQQKFVITFVELMDGAAISIGPLTVTPYRVVHASGAPPFTLRVACAGKVIAYSGDTEWTEALIQAAHGADLFICEAYYFDKKVKYHLDYATLRQHRLELGYKRLIVTHMSEDMLLKLPDLAVDAAEDGKCLVLS